MPETLVRGVSLEREKCTGCGVCVRLCSPGALKSVIETDKLRLVFASSLCKVDCNECEKGCPEEALKVTESTLVPENEVVLFESPVSLCSRCNTPFAPAALIQKLQNALKERSSEVKASLSLCPTCRREDVLKKMAAGDLISLEQILPKTFR